MKICSPGRNLCAYPIVCDHVSLDQVRKQSVANKKNNGKHDFFGKPAPTLDFGRIFFFLKYYLRQKPYGYSMTLSTKNSFFEQILWGSAFESTISYFIVQSSTLQYNILFYSTEQYLIVQCRTLQYRVVPYSTISYFIVQSSTLQYNIVLYTTEQYLIVQYRTVCVPNSS